MRILFYLMLVFSLHILSIFFHKIHAKMYITYSWCTLQFSTNDDTFSCSKWLQFVENGTEARDLSGSMRFSVPQA